MAAIGAATAAADVLLPAAAILLRVTAVADVLLPAVAILLRAATAADRRTVVGHRMVEVAASTADNR